MNYNIKTILIEEKEYTILIGKNALNQVSGLLFQHKTNVPRNTKVIYTQVKNVKLTKTPGSVTTKNTRFI